MLAYTFFALASLLGIPYFEIMALVTFLAIPLNYESSMLKRFVAAVCSYLCIQILVGAFIFGTGILRYETPRIAEVTPLFLTAGIFAFILTSLFRSFRNIKTSAMIFPATGSSFIIVPAFSIAILVIAALYMDYLPQPIVALMSFIAVLITAITFYFQNNISKAYLDKLKSTLHAQEKEYYFAQCQLMQESVESIRSIRHDMKSHLAMARDFTADNKSGEATNYLNGLLGDIDNYEIYSNTKNIAFDSIINFKLNNAKQEGIKTDIRLLIPPALNIEIADIVTILGNLLDNALDAVSRVSEKTIKLDIEYGRESLFIQVENTFDGVVEYAGEANGTNGGNKHLATRKSGDEHGFGLKNVRKSVEKYNGHIDISHDEKFFSVGVLLYVGASDTNSPPKP
jgi:signal transduction histidine kinase